MREPEVMGLRFGVAMGGTATSVQEIVTPRLGLGPPEGN